MKLSRTFVLIKPDGVRRGLIPDILARLQKAGLTLVKIQSGQCEIDQAMKHYENLRDRGAGIQERNAQFISEGMTVALILEGRNAVARARQTIGATQPLEASPGTIRGDFGTDSIELATIEERGLENLAHSSDSEESARREISLWFPAFPV